MVAPERFTATFCPPAEVTLPLAQVVVMLPGTTVFSGGNANDAPVAAILLGFESRYVTVRLAGVPLAVATLSLAAMVTGSGVILRVIC